MASGASGLRLATLTGAFDALLRLAGSHDAVGGLADFGSLVAFAPFGFCVFHHTQDRPELPVRESRGLTKSTRRLW